MAAPMFLVTGPAMANACAKAGIACGIPVLNARTPPILEEWLSEMDLQSGLIFPNVIVHRSNPRSQADLDIIVKYRPPVVISALGHPAAVVEAVHSYGGLVFADVNSMKFAKKAIEAGVDGLVLVCAGAGGHTGSLSPFAFIPAVRKIFKGIIIAGGAVHSGAGIKAMRTLGADIAAMGTHFISAQESLASDAYKQMTVNTGIEDIVPSSLFTGVTANYLMPSVAKAGLTIDDLGKQRDEVIIDDEKSRSKAWKDIWSAGQGVGSSNEIRSIQSMVDELEQQYKVIN